MFENVYKVNYELEDKYWWFVARNNIVLHLTLKYADINKEDIVLDFGCGTGGFANLISKHFNVIGLDTSPIAIDYCRKRGLNNLFLGSIDDFIANRTPVKAIFALDVIEHIEDDKEVVQKLRALLTDGGFLIVTVPAFSWLWSNHDILHMHWRRYTKKQLKNLLEFAGFKVVFISYFNFFLFLPAVLKRIFGKKKKLEDTPPVEPVSDFLNKVFRKIFEFEKYILPIFRFPFGLSIVVIAKKCKN